MLRFHKGHKGAVFLSAQGYMICSNLLIFKGYSSDDSKSSDEYPLKISDLNGTNLLKSTIILLGFIVLAGSLAAQNTQALFDQLDARIEHFSERAQRDSFLFYSDQKIKLARENNQLAPWAEAYIDIQYYLQSEPNLALQYLDEALAQKWREPADFLEWEQFCYIFAFRGYHLSQISQIWPAVQAYETANALYDRFHFPDFNITNWVYKPLGNNYTRLGDNEKALAVFQKALAGGHEAEVSAGLYGNIGIAYWNEGNMKDAEENCRRGLLLPGISAAKRALLQSVSALVQLDTERPELARKTALKALELLPAASNNDLQRLEDRARIRRTAGLACARTGRFAEARRLLNSALADARRVAGNKANRDVGKIELASSECFLRQNQAQQALEAANRALRAVMPNFKPKQAENNPDPAGFYQENTIFEALIAKAAAAESLFQQTKDARWLKLALDCHDLAHTAEMRLRAVFQYESSKLGLQSVAHKRDAAAMQIARTLFEKTGDAVYAEKGFEIAERSKAALLLDALRDQLVRQQMGNNPQFQLLASLRQTAAWYEKQLLLEPGSAQAAQWRADLDVLTGKINDLKNSMPGIRALDISGEEKPLAISFPADEMLLEYFVGEGFIEVFTLEGNKIRAWDRVGNDAGFQTLAQRFQTFFADGNAILNDPAGYLQTAYALWQKLLPGACAGAPKLLIIPDGFLNFIPFEALVTAQPEGRASLQKAAYLIRSQQVRYAWSWQVLQGQNALVSQAPDFFLGIAPLFEQGERGLAPLPGSREEWKEISRSNLDELLGNEATSVRFLAAAGKHRVLHLSTHAFAGGGSGLLPRIELFDQAMLLPDIYTLPLQADLVVLSACETGIGADQKGEGVMSLARAFAQAGAACIVSSLWTVNDQSTGQVLQRFYQNIKEKQAIGAALRGAKLDYLDRMGVPAMRQSPYFWAGLVEVGSDRMVAAPGNSSLGLILLVCCILMGIFWYWKRQRSNV